MFLGLDLGTTNIKAVLVGPDGRVVARSSAPVECAHTSGGGVEQDIEAIWPVTLDALRELGAAAEGPRVRAIGVSAQGGALQITGGDGCPVGPVISWMDNRGREFNEALTRELGRDWFVRHIGHGRSNMAIGQLLRLRAESPATLAPPNRVGFVGDVIVSRLCGRAAHDATSLSIAFLFNPSLRDADPGVLERVGITADQLPALLPVRTSAGGLLDDVAAKTSLPAGIPVSPAVHDQYAAALGSGSVHAGDVMFGAGTAWVLLAATGRLMEPVIDGAFVCTHVVDGLYGQMLSMVNGGSVFAWAVAGLGLAGRGRGELDAMMASVAPGSEGLRFRPTMTAGGGEGLPPGTRGGLSGIELSHEPRQILRAVTEGLAAELARYVRFLTDGGVTVKRLVMTGGAAASSVTPQVVADVTGLPLVCTAEREMSAFGAAVIARGLAEPDAGLAAISEQVRPPSRDVTPSPDAAFYKQLLADYLAELPGASS